MLLERILLHFCQTSDFAHGPVLSHVVSLCICRSVISVEPILVLHGFAYEIIIKAWPWRPQNFLQGGRALWSRDSKGVKAAPKGHNQGTICAERGKVWGMGFPSPVTGSGRGLLAQGGHGILVIINWCGNIMVTVRWIDKISNFFHVTSGVRQSGILSPFLFIVFINLIIMRLNECGFGCVMNAVQYIGCIIHRESEKGDTILLSVSLLNIDRYS